jgi:hypothetical protein
MGRSRCRRRRTTGGATDRAGAGERRVISPPAGGSPFVIWPGHNGGTTVSPVVAAFRESRCKELHMLANSAVTGDTTAVDLEYVAVCIAEQIVRIKLSAARRQLANDQAHDTSPALTRPLIALAITLGIHRQVKEHVADALPGAII